MRHTACEKDLNLYIFGGVGDMYYSDLWKFDTITELWSLILSSNSSQPDPRSGHSACILQNKLFIFGGFSKLAGGLRNDLWYFDFGRISLFMIY